jgi:choline kinase
MNRTIIITMAGRGSRFKQAGIRGPKFLIEIDGRTMFEYALMGLSDFSNDSFVFITRADHNVDDVIATHCDRVGIDDFETVSVPEVTDGQASTAIYADDLTPDEETVAIFNIDTYIEPDELRGDDVGLGHCIPVFSPEGERWSFVQTDENGSVTRVTEKERVSDMATIGFYQFDSWDRFKTAYEATAEDVKAEYGETYIAPLYNRIIEQDDEINLVSVPTDSVHVLGTPEDVCAFYPPFAEEYDL